MTVTDVTIDNGSSTANFRYYDSVRGDKTITASVTGYMTPTASQPVTVTGGTATRLVLTGTTSTTAGVPISLTITALDAFDNVADQYDGYAYADLWWGRRGRDGRAALCRRMTRDHTLGDGHAYRPSPMASRRRAAGANGVLALYLAETATITATDGPISTVPDGNLTVTVDPASATYCGSADASAGDLIAEPSPSAAGTPITIYARGLDPYRNLTGQLNARLGDRRDRWGDDDRPVDD